MNREINKNFKKIAKYYNNYHKFHINFIELIKKEYKISDKSIIVDMGCGTGNETLNVYDNFKCKVYGIEPAKNMLFLIYLILSVGGVIYGQ